MIKYVFKADRPLLGVRESDKADAQVIGEALDEITQANSGHLTAKSVVDAARNTRNALHRYFEWDNVKAAESFRLDQARTLIASIHTEVAETQAPVRAFLSVNDDKQGKSYRTVREIMSSSDLQLKVLEAAERDLLAFEGRYRNLQEICTLVRTVRTEVTRRKSERKGSEARVS